MITTTLAGVILLAGLALVVVGSRPPPERTFKGSVHDLLPKPEEIPGWTVDYLPIADTPEMKEKVSELLNYDDAVFAVYKKGNDRLSVYIAYWLPEKMAYRYIASHTPDVCWVLGGWTTKKTKSDVTRRTSTGLRMLPVEERIMERGGHRENLVFWHLLDGKPMNYGVGGVPPWYAPITDMILRRLNQKPEQFFIRISSNLERERWDNMEAFNALVVRLSVLHSHDESP